MDTYNNIDKQSDEKTLDKARMIIRAIMAANIALSALTVTLFESGMLPAGILAGTGNTEFVFTMAMELITICAIPVAVRLFKFKRINNELKTGGGNALMKWGSIRMLMLSEPLFANTVLYYLFMNVAFGYMAIILLICLMFISPGKRRCKAETGGEA